MTPAIGAPPANRGAVNTAHRVSEVFAPLDVEREPVTVSLHWLAATTTWDVTDCVMFIADYLGCAVEQFDRGRQGYTSTWQFGGGLVLLDNPSRPEMGRHLIASGEVCEHFGFDKLAHIYQALDMKATRVDLAADNCAFSPLHLYSEWLQDKVRTRCQLMKDAKVGMENVRTHRWESSPTGDTLYMGSRSSTVFARCYDMRGPTRLELEFKGERAEQIAAFAINAAGNLAPLFRDSVDQFVAFVELDDSNRARCSVQPFWADFLEELGEGSNAVTLLSPRPARSVQRNKEWLERQVSRGLLLYSAVAAVEAEQNGLYQGNSELAERFALERLLDIGRERWDKSDDMLIEMHRVSHQEIIKGRRPLVFRLNPAKNLGQTPILD